jgi:SAM-dependent methyltransferase
MARLDMENIRSRWKPNPSSESGFSRGPVNLELIREINLLWKPVYPYLAQAVREYYGRREGALIEIGPFCGVIFELRKQGIGDSYLIGAFPRGLADTFREQARRGRQTSPIDVIETDAALEELDENSVDLIIFRGALFFPSLFRVGWEGIHRVLKPNGVALVGGGFGKFTPQEVIEKIANRSRALNLQLGKVDVTPAELKAEMERFSFKASLKILSEGGLWVLMKKR